MGIASNLTYPQTQACLNFDTRRKPGDQVNLFSCGGRADGGMYSLFLLPHERSLIICLAEGEQVDSQLYAFAGGAGPVTLEPKSNAGTCLVAKGNVLDQAACSKGDATQSFTLG